MPAREREREKKTKEREWKKRERNYRSNSKLGQWIISLPIKNLKHKNIFASQFIFRKSRNFSLQLFFRQRDKNGFSKDRW